jgi:hypothetical protein
MVAVIPGWIRDRLFGVGDIQHEEPIGEKADPILLDEVCRHSHSTPLSHPLIMVNHRRK